MALLHHQIHPLQSLSTAVFKSTRLQWRCLSLTTHQLTPKKPVSAPKQAKTKPQVAAHTNLPSARSKYQSFADTLASRKSPTLLYEAPSSTLYITGCYLFSTACFSIGGINFYNSYLHPPAELSSWLSVAVGGACVAMTFFGLWSLLGVYPPKPLYLTVLIYCTGLSYCAENHCYATLLQHCAEFAVIEDR